MDDFLEISTIYVNSVDLDFNGLQNLSVPILGYFTISG